MKKVTELVGALKRPLREECYLDTYSETDNSRIILLDDLFDIIPDLDGTPEYLYKFTITVEATRLSKKESAKYIEEDL